MGEVFRSSRFWIALVVCGGIIAFGVLKLVTGQEAIMAMSSLLAGFGIGKAGGSGKLDALIEAGVRAALKPVDEKPAPAAGEEKPDA
jgi:hypothetical protein